MKSTGQTATTLRINPTNAYGGVASDYFKFVKYIPLQTTKESVFGTIDKLEVTDKYFIFLDRTLNCIYIFFKNGKFHCKIKLPNLRSSTFLLNRREKKIYFELPLPHGKGEITKYDYDGKLLERQITKYYIGRNYINLDSTFIVYNSNIETTNLNLHYYLISTKNRETYKNYLPFNKDTSLFKYLSLHHLNYYNNGNFFPIYGTTNSLFTKPFDYTIYQVNSKGVSPYYKFIFPFSQSWKSDTMAINKIKSQKNILGFEIKSEIIASINPIYKIKDNLVFNLSSRKSIGILIYNLITNKLISYPNITSDSSSFYLPIYNRNNRVLACDTSNIYTYFSSLQMIQAKIQTESKHVLYDATIDNYFKKQTRMSNGVIVILNLKKKL